MRRVSAKGGGRLHTGVAAHDGDPRILWVGAQEPWTTVHWTPRAGQCPCGDGRTTAFEVAAHIGHVIAREFDKVGHDQQVGIDVAIPGRQGTQ
jgi:hypothetical protein